LKHFAAVLPVVASHPVFGHPTPSKLYKVVNLLISELTSLEDLFHQLRVTYEKVVAGEGSALIGAKGIVTTAVHFYRNCGQLNVLVCLIFLVIF